MRNAINDLRLKWRARAAELRREADRAEDGIRKLYLDGKIATLGECVTELVAAVDAVHPPPLTEGSTEKLYRWSDRMVRIFDLMLDARSACARNDRGELATIAEQLGLLADAPLVNDIYDLLKQLANRSPGARR